MLTKIWRPAISNLLEEFLPDKAGVMITKYLLRAMESYNHFRLLKFTLHAVNGNLRVFGITEF